MLSVFVISLCLVSVVRADDIEDHVLVLTKDNFTQTLDKYPFVLVEFYAPWCGHCKALEPHYKKAALEMSTKNADIKIAKVDATVETDLSEKHQVRGYPTLKFFRKDSKEPVEYTGGREAEDIVKWLIKKTGDAAVKLSTVAELTDFKATGPVSVVGYFADLESDAAKAYMLFATHNDEYPLAITASKDVAAELKLDADGVVLFHNFDEIGYVKHTGKIETEELAKFVAANSLPLVVDFTHETAKKIFGGDTKVHNLMFLKKSAPDTDKAVDVFKTVAKEFKGQVLFVTIDADVEDHLRIMEFFGVKLDELPVLRMIKLENDMLRYKPQDAEITVESVTKFVNGVLDGTIKQHLLTQDLPEDWDKNPVKVLVSTNFDEVAFDKSKNVLVEFYAPWCGHCKNLAPIYEQLAESYKDKTDVLIAKMDATQNELEHTKIASFPTLKLYKKDTNEVVEYNGERTLEGLKKFIDSDGEYGRAPEEDVDEEDEEEKAGKPDAKKDEL